MTRLIILAHRLLINITLLMLILGGSALPALGQGLAQPQAALATNCKWYAAPSGSASNTGTAPTSPLTLVAAYQKATAGSVICLLPGTYNISSPFYLSKGGASTAYIIYQSYDYANQALINWTASGGGDMFQVNSNAAYIAFYYLKFNGNNRAYTGIKCSSGSHHLIASYNSISNAGASAIASVGCDYMKVVGNKIYHTGYGAGWGSGISLNTSYWYDQYAGFHSYVIGNIVAGTVDNSTNHSDGNGIIIDMAKNTITGTPPVLIANNLTYENGARCIHAKEAKNVWVVNNTCYKNGLDLRNNPALGEYSSYKTTNSYAINNIVHAWSGHPPFRYELDNGTIRFYRNSYYQGGANVLPAGVINDTNQMRNANPLFVNPISVDPTLGGQYNTALAPDQVGNRFQLQPTSPLINIGVDPRTVAGVTPEIKAGLDAYVLKDIRGVARPQGSGFDLGAYEYNGL